MVYGKLQGEDYQIIRYRTQVVRLLNNLVDASNLAVNATIHAKDNKDRLNIIEFILNVIKEGILTEMDLSVISITDCSIYHKAICSLHISMVETFNGITNDVKRIVDIHNKELTQTASRA